MIMPQKPGGERQPGSAMRYDEEEDLDIGRAARVQENPSSAGLIGFLAALVSIGLLLVVLVLFIFLEQENEHLDRRRLLYYWFLLLDVISFFAGLTATILGARGSAPTNTHYRGYGVAALVLGIIEMAITVLFGFWMSCAVLLVTVRQMGAG